MKKIAIILISISAISNTVCSHPLDQWFWRNPSPQGNSLASVAFGQNRFVAVGGGGVILSSGDGSTWTLETSPTTNSLADVAYLNGKFIAVGDKGTIVTSTNGSNWGIVPSGVTTSLASSAYGNGSYVIVGLQSTVLQSYTATSWTPASGVLNTLYLNSVTFGAGTFIAITSAGNVIQSADGLVWSSQPNLGGYPSQVNYVNGRFLILDETLWSSVYGTNWTSTWVNPAPEKVIFGTTNYVGVGTGGVIQRSANATNWAWVTTYLSSDDLTGIAFGNGTYVAVGALGVIRTSTDLITWTFRNKALTYGGTLFGVEYINDEFVAVGASKVGPGGYGEFSPVLFSGPATSWYRQDSGAYSTIYDVAYGAGIYVLANAFGVQTSTNRLNWASPPCGLSSQLSAVNYVNGLFVLSGWSGGISTSPDGINWLKRTNGTTRTMMDTTYGNGLYVSVGRTPGGSSGVILTSSDGIIWTNRSAANLCGICMGKGLFVIVGDGGLIRTSTNAVNWTTQLSGVTVNLWGVTFGDGMFAAVGDQGTLITSPDGIIWTRRKTGTSQSLQKVAYGRGTFVMVGAGSIVLQSAPTVPSIRPRPLTNPARLELNLVGGFDRSYAIQVCSNLNSDVWADLTTLPQGQRLFVDNEVSNSRKFYRVRVSDQ